MKLKMLRNRTFFVLRDMLNKAGINISLTSDFYSPLPVIADLKKNINRWNRPSELVGLQLNKDDMAKYLSDLISNYLADFMKLPPYLQNKSGEYGPGFPYCDAFVLYSMIRKYHPAKYVEVGSGLSTLYCHLGRENSNGNYTDITCIEPFPHNSLKKIPDINLIIKEVQDVDYSVFLQLEEGDMLFIDSTHILKIDGDLPYLYLEILPRLKKGVIIHIHDIPFPFNVPYPPEYWVLSKTQNPKFWNEAMLLQAFLCFNDAYEVKLSMAYLRYYNEAFLKGLIPFYENKKQNPDTFSSIWIEKVK